MDPSDEPRQHPDRQIADKLLLMFGVIAGVTLVLSVLLLALLTLFRPDADTTELTKMLNTQVSIIIGAVLGYIARPAVDRHAR